MKNQLSNAQQQAVIHKDGPMLVLAGPGTGKTTVIARRTQHLIQHHLVNPSQILVITFTKAAAKEMKERFLQLTKSQSTNVSFGTFHAVFFQILKLAYGFGAENILREEQKWEFLKEAIRKANLDLDDEADFMLDLASEISRVKNERANLKTYKSTSCNTEIFRKIYHDYDNRLRRRNLIDFDDMLVYCYELLKERPDILQAWQRKYRYILVDEFQDINQLQYDIIRLLAAPENNLFVVGDDDQSIYRFRGAKPEIMLHFEKDYPEACRVILDTNFRSTPEIVCGAEKVIAYNKTRFNKVIRAKQDAGFSILTHHFPGQKEEIECIIDKIQTYAGRGGDYSDIAVLYRTNTQPRLLVEQLVTAGIPFRMRDALPNFYDHWIVRDVFAYVRLAHGSKKRSDFLQIMNRPKRYIERDALEEEEISWECLLEWYKGKPWVAERIGQFQRDLKMVERLSPFGAIHYIRNVIGYEAYTKQYAQNRNLKPDEFLEVLDELQLLAKGFKSFEEWFAHIEAYRQELARQAKEQALQKNAVTLSTIHSSKGLEYRIVFIPDANETIMPHKRAFLEEDIEEERRLFYVAMTRAKELLYIFSVKKLFHKKAERSRFVDELLEE